MPADLYIGLMSGTSADSIDAALVEISNKPRLIATHSQPLADSLREEIVALSLPGHNEITRAGTLDRKLGILFAECTNRLLTNSGTKIEDITAIGSHGQTIRHEPPIDSSVTAFTVQIGDPNTIAELTGITTIADFRRRDIAAGGHGAPLAPAFHQALFQPDSGSRFIVNIGGMSNVTALGPAASPTIGFDTGPGNVLMDGWINRHLQKPYDHDGEWAKSGKVSPELLAVLMAHPFLQLPPPKSTGREAFNLAWLDRQLSTVGTLHPADTQATLLEFTARSITQALESLAVGDIQGDVYVCGGGAYNKALMTRLAELHTGGDVLTTDALGIKPDWVEAVAFAWLAHQTIRRQPGNLTSVTGASHSCILGGIYYP